MGIGNPRELYEREITSTSPPIARFCRFEAPVKRPPPGRLPADAEPRHAHARAGSASGRTSSGSATRPTGVCRAPRVVERQCAARGADACVIDVRWRNPSRGRAVLGPDAARGGAAAALDGRVRGRLTRCRGPRRRLVAPLPAAARRGDRLRAAPGRPAPAHAADARSPVRGDPVLEQRAREEVPRSRDDDRAALPAERPGRRRRRDARRRRRSTSRRSSGSSTPWGTRGPISPRGPGPARRPRPPDGGGRRGRGAVPGHGVRRSTTRARARPGRLDRASRSSWTTSSAPDQPIDVRERARLGVRSVVLVPLRVKGQVFGVLSVASSEPGRVGAARRGAALRRGQPRGPRRGPGGELPDHRGAVPGPRGQGARADRAARDRERGAAGGLPRSPGHPDAAHPAREDGVDGPARGRGRPRAQQPHRLRVLQRHHARGLRQAAPRHARGLPGPHAARRRPSESGRRRSGRAARSTTRSGTSTR